MPIVVTFCASKVHRASRSGRGKPERLCILAFPVFSRHICGTQENCLFNFHAFVALKLLVSVLGRLVAYSARTRVDRQTDRHTDQVL